MQPRGCSDSKCTSLPELDWLLKILKDTAAFSLQSWNACALFYFVHQAGSRVTVWFWCRTTFFLFLNEHNVPFGLFGLLCAVYQWENGSFHGDRVVCDICLRVRRILCLCVTCVVIFFLPLLISHQNRRFCVKVSHNCAFFLLLYAGVSNIRLFYYYFFRF